KTPPTIVIVECGFLSNSEEAEKLCSKEYQEKLAWEIHLGILQYLNELK
ncbi:MAG: N-acetylmuramoyl-L-alanine amidase, partial [Lachnospiraceae bacterium]|nr:N-acetylmuramoyl-L-alanine amidase [Lachnospiraceae bacterium]